MKKVQVNFFVEHHGKSPVDSHFSLLSRTINRISKNRKIENITQLQEEITKEFLNYKTKSEFIIYEQSLPRGCYSELKFKNNGILEFYNFSVEEEKIKISFRSCEPNKTKNLCLFSFIRY